MTPERWDKVNKIFQSAAELTGENQKEYLNDKCADDLSLREQVETLLAADLNAGTFIAGNAASDVNHLVNPDIDKTLTGESFNNYEIISLLGKGGMGKVYLAKDAKLNRSIALKTIPMSFSSHREHLKRFETEARAAATLNHPNVATIYSVEETEEDRVFITMEYVKGKPLDEHFEPNGIDLKTFLQWFVPLTDALGHAHDAGVVHRDIKPSNIMLTPDGVPKILDFGLARIDRNVAAEDESTLSLTKTGQVMGTPAYMSPEQAEGKALDHRTDIFSLGVMMYEAITGKRPFEGDSYASVVSALLTKTPQDIRAIRGDIPELIARLIMKCLEKNPQHRYRSMTDVRVLLGELNSAIGSGASISIPSRLSGGSAKAVTKFLFPVLAFAGLAGALLFGFLYFSNQKPESTPTHYTLQFADSKVPNLTDFAIAPDGRSVLYTDKFQGQEMIFRRSLDGFQSEVVRGTEDPGPPFFSPDGEWIAFRWGAKGLRKVPSSGGNPIPICLECRPTGGGSWGNDGMIVFNDKEGMALISPEGGTVKRITEVDTKNGERSHYEPAFLPNGKDIIFTIRHENVPKPAIFDAKTGKHRILTKAGLGTYASYFNGHLLFTRRRVVYSAPFDLDSLDITAEPKQLLEGIYAFYPKLHFSNDRTLFYMPAVKHNDSRLVWVTPSGEESDAVPDLNEYSTPRISPDETKVAVVIEGDMWVRDLGSTKGTRLSSAGSASYPIWSRDGKFVYFTIEKENNWTIFRRSADGRGQAEVIFESKHQIRPNDIHPTDNEMVLGDFPSRGVGNIAVLDLETKKLTTLIENGFTNDMPRFSPDGTWLAYFTVESGKTQNFVVPWKRDGSRVLITEGKGLYPVFSGDSQFIYTRTPTNTYVTPITLGEKPTVGATRISFKENYRTVFDASKNGNKLIMVKTKKNIFPGHLNVITSFDNKLK